MKRRAGGVREKGLKFKRKRERERERERQRGTNGQEVVRVGLPMVWLMLCTLVLLKTRLTKKLMMAGSVRSTALAQSTCVRDITSWARIACTKAGMSTR